MNRKELMDVLTEVDGKWSVFKHHGDYMAKPNDPDPTFGSNYEYVGTIDLDELKLESHNQKNVSLSLIKKHLDFLEEWN
ncbi:MAG: hypothetical protein M1521_08685 [Thermotogae bacterium]|jgi:hypothetical protein|nr:hypothetical protein [Thermotogota bacterium]